MTTVYPSALDNPTNPTATDLLASLTVPHATQHANANDAIKALEAKLGIGVGASSANAILVGTGVGSSSWLTTGLTNTHISTTAAIALSKLAATTTGLVRSNGTVMAGGATVADADVAAGAAIALSKLAATAAGVVKSNGATIFGGNSIADADVTAGAGIQLSKIAHVGAGNVIKSNGSTNAAGQVATADIAAHNVTNYYQVFDGAAASYGPGGYVYSGLTVGMGALTVGSQIYACTFGSFYNNTVNAINSFSLNMDAVSQSTYYTTVSTPVAGAVLQYFTGGLFSATLTGHTMYSGWTCNAGTMIRYGSAYMMAIELKR